MPDKQKVTLYISDELHRQFKIRSAVDGETMSSMAQRALEFYLAHSDLVQSGSETHGRTHQIHSCPRCNSAVTLSGNKLNLIHAHADGVKSDLTGLEHIPNLQSPPLVKQGMDNEPLSGTQESQCDAGGPGEGELITC